MIGTMSLFNVERRQCNNINLVGCFRQHCSDTTWCLKNRTKLHLQRLQKSGPIPATIYGTQKIH